jgi:hypothetical protein
MNGKVWMMLGACLSSLALPEAAKACGGGGIVSSEAPGRVGANAQRVLISVHDDGVGGTTDGTDIIAQIVVPETTADYGALLPMPSEPTLDPEPVSIEELEQLDVQTAPQIVTIESTDDGGGSGCGCLGTGAATRDAGESKSVRTSEPVDIGPVTAVVLSGNTDAVNAWLDENGFFTSKADQATISDYAGYYFVAIRRNERAAPGGPTSIGIHFSMSGDHRELPLRFASLGAAPTVAFTLFLASSDLAGPSPPFAALTLDDLDGSILRTGGYAAALQDVVRAHGHQAFVLESRTSSADLALSGKVRSVVRGTVTRMSTIVPASALTEDAHFYAAYEGEIPNERFAAVHRYVGSREASIGSLGGLVLLGALRRRNTRANQRSGT